MRKGVEERRKELIYKLMVHTVNKTVEQLMKLTLKELETEYKKVQNDCHPIVMRVPYIDPYKTAVG
ncbi:hypothetical protein KEH51_00385 [[Brevibacterium] frigoritolerans]|uniref:Fur-regulated basic protein FbpA n=1 Tax=Peribacillus frigoritolerans TaxID=450367 RepID=A0A941FFF3_9BACI|nr:hypothetical protein [Peribacillus frigoritolerans]